MGARGLAPSLARALKAQGKGGSEQALEEATKLAPGSLPLLSYQSEELIHTSGWELAEELIGVGLKANPRYLPLLELKAAYYFFKEEPKKFEKAQEKVLQINPSNGDYFELLGDFCIRRRRLEEGIDFSGSPCAGIPSNGLHWRRWGSTCCGWLKRRKARRFSNGLMKRTLLISGRSTP